MEQMIKGMLYMAATASQMQNEKLDSSFQTVSPNPKYSCNIVTIFNKIYFFNKEGMLLQNNETKIGL